MSKAKQARPARSAKVLDATSGPLPEAWQPPPLPVRPALPRPIELDGVVATVRSPESSNVARVRYHEPTLQLEVTYKTGAIYRYQKAPAFVLTQIAEAPSVGRYVARLLLGGPAIKVERGGPCWPTEQDEPTLWEAAP